MKNKYIQLVLIVAIAGSATNGICGAIRTGISVNDIRVQNDGVSGASSLVVDVVGLPDMNSRRLDSVYLHLELMCSRSSDAVGAGELVSLAVSPIDKGGLGVESADGFDFLHPAGVASEVVIDITRIVDYWLTNESVHSLEIYGVDEREEAYTMSFAAGQDYAGWLEVRYSEGRNQRE